MSRHHPVVLVSLLCLVLTATAVGLGSADVLWLDGLIWRSGEMNVPNPTGTAASSWGNTVSVADDYIVWSDKSTVDNDDYDVDNCKRIYGYDLDADSDSDGYPDVLCPNPDVPGDRPAAVALTPNDGHDRESPDVYDNRVVYQYNNTTYGWDIRWCVVGGSEYTVYTGSHDQIEPRISKYGSYYYVVWEDHSSSDYRVRWRALPSTPGNCTSTIRTASSSGRDCIDPDIGGRYVVYEIDGLGIYRSDYDGSPLNQKIADTNSTCKLPCADADHLAYLASTGTPLWYRVYAVSHADALTSGTRVRVAGTSAEDTSGYRIQAVRPAVAQGVVAWTWSDTRSPREHHAAMANIAVMAVDGNDDHTIDMRAFTADEGFERFKDVAMSLDRYSAYRTQSGSANPRVGYLRTNMPDMVPGDSGYEALLLHPLADPDTRCSYDAEAYLRNFSTTSWSTSYRLRRLTNGQSGYPGHRTCNWPLNTSYDWDFPSSGKYVSSTTSPQKLATFSWTFEAPTKAGRYAFDFGMYYGGWLTKFYPSPSGTEAQGYYDLLKIRSDVWFRSFPDVIAGTPFWDEIEACHYHWSELSKPRIISGYEDGDFEQNGNVDRATMSVFIYRANQSPNYTPPQDPTFPDVPPSYWAYKQIEYCHSQGIVGGYPDGLFHPDWLCDRAQGCVFLTRALGGNGSYTPATYYYTDVSSSHWAKSYIYWLADVKHLKDFYSGSQFRPGDVLTRAELCVFVTYGYRLTLPTRNDAYPW